MHYLALWFLVRVAGRLPPAALEAVAAAAGTVAWWGSRRLRAVTRDHMCHVLGVAAPRGEVDRAARECLRVAARGYAEFAHLPHLSPDAVRARVVATDGMEALAEAAREGHGVILVSAHLGAPEVMTHVAPAFGIDLAAVAEPLQPPRVHDFVHRIRAVHGVRYLPATLGGLREARAHLARGGVLGLLADRDVLGTGRSYPFFGERALMPTGAVELARRTGAPIVVVWAYRDRRAGHYRLVGRRIAVPPDTGDREADLDAGMRVLIASLEQAIRAAPGQWFPLQPVWPERIGHRSAGPRRHERYNQSDDLHAATPES